MKDKYKIALDWSILAGFFSLYLICLSVDYDFAERGRSENSEGREMLGLQYEGGAAGSVR